MDATILAQSVAEVDVVHRDASLRVRFGHSPDPDDAFMFYGIAAGKVDTSGYVIEQVLEDIETLNRRALQGELEVTALSIHAYAYLSDLYVLMPCGASMGDGYGPLVVSREIISPEALASKTIAVPGLLTSAFLALRLYVGRDFARKVLRFDRILEAVAAGEADAGLIIHEGQLTYRRSGLEEVLDLGRWWAERTAGLPLPLGGNAIRKDLGPEVIGDVTRILRDSIDYGLAHRGEALAYARDFGRGLDNELTDRFVGMYVNDLTRDHGARGREAIGRFLALGAEAGLVPRVSSLEFVD